MLRRLAVFFLVLSLLAVIGFALVKLTERAGLMPDLSGFVTDVEIDMAAKGIELTHGNEGKLIWRLRAESASYDQEKGLVLVQTPNIDYFTQPSDKLLHVRAPQGSVHQESSEVHFWPEVTALYEKASLTAKEIMYDGQGLLTASGGAVVKQEGVTLMAPVMHFDLNARVFVAEGGVVVESGTDKIFTDPLKANAP
ncbi:LPS export ABC transporter periplasmic protein LptC [Desulfocurvibacter africanus]|uniref:LPS export ABC transporter periplasmic protein LptC n=1 Tax=Desulfocurvibacter africanus TaxID=873 RepID=UPI002FD8B519